MSKFKSAASHVSEIPTGLGSTYCLHIGGIHDFDLMHVPVYPITAVTASLSGC